VTETSTSSASKKILSANILSIKVWREINKIDYMRKQITRDLMMTLFLSCITTPMSTAQMRILIITIATSTPRMRIHHFTGSLNQEVQVLVIRTRV